MCKVCFNHMKNITFVCNQHNQHIYYPGIQLSIPCTPGQFFMGAKLFIGTPLMENKVVLKINRYELCEHAWFPWQQVI